MTEAATMVGNVSVLPPSSGATMSAVKGERVVFVSRSTVFAGVLAVTMVSQPTFSSKIWSAAEGGETVNRGLTLAEDQFVEQAEVDLEALNYEPEVFSLAAGLRLAELPAPYPPADPDLLQFEE